VNVQVDEARRDVAVAGVDRRGIAIRDCRLSHLGNPAIFDA
jgi:hypothetical protein